MRTDIRVDGNARFISMDSMREKSSAKALFAGRQYDIYFAPLYAGKIPAGKE
jgi:hypothetical protein